MTIETTAEEAELEPTLLDSEPVSTPTEFTNGTAVTADVPQSSPEPQPVSGAERATSRLT